MINVTSLNAIPSMSALLGTKGDSMLLSHINKAIGSNYFGSTNDRYATQYNNFLSTYIEPIKLANNEIRVAVERLQNPEGIRKIDNYDDLRNVPSSMMMPILTYGPMFTLLRQGRIDGWGFNPDWLEEEKDIYDRLIDKNGVLDISEENPEYPEGSELDEDQDPKDTYIQRTEYDLLDPEITHEDRIFIMETRDFIQKILDETDLDPTDLDNIRG